MRTTVVSLFVAFGMAGPLIGAAPSPALAEDKPDDGNSVVIEGEASFYGGKFNGRKTANGETFNENKMTAASKELPLGSTATVTHEETGKSVDVKINDRGPYVDGRVLDLSKGAAKKLDMIDDGTAPVRIEADPDKQPNDKVREKVEDLAEKKNGGGDRETAKAD
ncbi:septal ring lytic transglycosylase RlpA family protein [Skermanella sp. TT6]|mgnify:FL=1|uniref:Endolytic peptidoglycan transglycosylase RlpA n=1 Tax=Skermanella cutis TaxID=2775420 RepID=A0ABX7B459_9PROT|nr:septal ring lytic transglycosylase RlpA family protein [Skermanella sp. TT6]QQP89136.1 septal ring lytic transglycosylase RlpA family protein [Skermanella sp. TT6]